MPSEQCHTHLVQKDQQVLEDLVYPKPRECRPCQVYPQRQGYRGYREYPERQQDQEHCSEDQAIQKVLPVQ
jgi:hypothetical protein